MIRLGKRGWELHPWVKCADCHPYPGLQNKLSAQNFLQQFKHDSFAAAAIQTFLSREAHRSTLAHATHEDAIDRMAVLLSLGLWHVHAPAHPKAEWGSAQDGEPEEDIAEIVQGPVVQNDSKPRPQPVAEEGSLPRSADEAAIAAALKTASKQGIPFCEECAKAAAKRAQVAA